MNKSHKFKRESISVGIKYIEQLCLKCGIKSKKYKSCRTYQYPDGKYSDAVPICKIEIK